MSEMRVALVGDYPLQLNNIKNGPQAVFAYLVEGLRKLPDLELNVVTAHKSLSEPYIAQQKGITFHYLPYPRLPAELSFPILLKSMHNVLREIKPDVVHGQSGHRYGCIALSAGFPTVLTVHNIHGTEPRYAPDGITRLRLRLHYALTRKYFLAHVRHLVSVNRYIRNHYEGIINADIYDIANPIANSFFELDSNEEDPNMVLFVGWLRTVKRPDLALEAFALAQQEIPNLYLHLAGTASEPKLKMEMDDFVSTHNLSSNVRFLGHLNLPQLLEAYQHSSILLLTSELETSPMVVQQAMAAGKAVIATAVGGVPFLIDDARTGLLVERDNTTQIAEMLVRLAQNPLLRKQLGQAARCQAINCFQTDVVAYRTYLMYREILNGIPCSADSPNQLVKLRSNTFRCSPAKRGFKAVSLHYE